MHTRDLQRAVLYDKKWFKFLKKTWLFKFVPFADFVFASGSIAIGNVGRNSDFDVLIGARQGRIFTARFFAVALFGLFGWRRKKMDHSAAAADKICLNHFVTPKTHRLTLGKNEFWKLYYRSLVPIYGDAAAMDDFLRKNSWAGELRYMADMRHLHRRRAWLTGVVERVLGGSFGNWVEKVARGLQVKRIKKGLPKENTLVGEARLPYGEGERSVEYVLPPLVLYTDDELQFHPNPARLKVFY